MKVQKKEISNELSSNHELAKTLSKLMKDANIKDPELSRLTGVPVSTLLKLRTIEHTNPTVETLLPIANFFGLNIQQLLGLELIDRPKGSFLPQYRKLKLVPILKIDEIIRWAQDKVSIEEGPTRQWAETSAEIASSGFALAVKDSLTSGRYPENALMIFDCSEKVKDKDIVVVQFDNQDYLAIRQIIFDSGDIYFKPFNPELDKIIFDTNYKIFGIMKQVIINT